MLEKLFRFSCIVWYCIVWRIVYNVNCMVLPGIACIVIQAKVLFCEQNPEDDGVQFSLILGQSLVWMAFNVWAVLCWHFTTNWVASDLRGKVVALEIVQERIFTTGTDKNKFSDNQSDRKSCYSKPYREPANSMVWSFFNVNSAKWQLLVRFPDLLCILKSVGEPDY